MVVHDTEYPCPDQVSFKNSLNWPSVYFCMDIFRERKRARESERERETNMNVNRPIMSGVAWRYHSLCQRRVTVCSIIRYKQLAYIHALAPLYMVIMCSGTASWLMLYFFIASQIAQVAQPIWLHWLGNFSNLVSKKEIQTDMTRIKHMK